jgi:hypothetical protein
LLGLPIAEELIERVRHLGPRIDLDDQVAGSASSRSSSIRIAVTACERASHSLVTSRAPTATVAVTSSADPSVAMILDGYPVV